MPTERIKVFLCRFIYPAQIGRVRTQKTGCALALPVPNITNTLLTFTNIMKKIKPLRVGSPPGVSSYILAYTLQFLCGVSPGSARQRSPRNPRGGTAYHMRAFVPVSSFPRRYAVKHIKLALEQCVIYFLIRCSSTPALLNSFSPLFRHFAE